MPTSISLTLANALSDTMAPNAAWDLPSAGIYVDSGTTVNGPEPAPSLKRPIINNVGTFQSALDGFAVGGVVAYKLPDNSLLVIYFNMRGVGVGIAPNGTPVNKALYTTGAGYKPTYVGPLVAGGKTHTLNVTSRATLSLDTHTVIGNIRCNCINGA